MKHCLQLALCCGLLCLASVTLFQGPPQVIMLTKMNLEWGLVMNYSHCCSQPQLKHQLRHQTQRGQIRNANRQEVQTLNMAARNRAAPPSVGSPTQQLASLPQGRAPKNRNHQNQRGTPCQIHAMDQRTRQKGTANQLGVIQEIQGRKTTTKARTTMVARITIVARKRARKKMRREGFYSTRKRVSSTRMTNGGCITISQEAHRI